MIAIDWTEAERILSEPDPLLDALNHVRPVRRVLIPALTQPDPNKVVQIGATKSREFRKRDRMVG
jgi:hypothetical protein